MKFCYFALFVLFVHLEYLSAISLNPVTVAAKKAVVSQNPADYLSFDYYLNTCPDAEGIIQQKVGAWIKKDPTLAPSIIRLHFHDCAVRGCDASILLNYRGSERGAYVSRTLRGFQVIDDIKAALEKRCRRTVSCADILTAAARDATVFAGGPFWQVPFGRKDGRISIAKKPKWSLKGMKIRRQDCCQRSRTLFRSKNSSLCRSIGLSTLSLREPVLVSMVKLGNVQVLTRNDGEVRLNCNYVNRR
ncbi:hypothetical protein SLA2020_412220 [Shorea laevis]